MDFVIKTCFHEILCFHRLLLKVFTFHSHPYHAFIKSKSIDLCQYIFIHHSLNFIFLLPFLHSIAYFLALIRRRSVLAFAKLLFLLPQDEKRSLQQDSDNYEDKGYH